MKIKKYFPFLAVLILASCKSDPETTSEEVNPDREKIAITHEQFEQNGMELGVILEKDFPNLIRTNGQIEVPPENLAKINVFEGGYVKRLPVLEGSKVKQGQLILVLENPRYVELQQEYLELAGQLNYLESEFERQQVMLEENITSRKNFLRAESEYKSGLARYEGLRQKLQMLNIDPQQVEEGKVTSQVNIYAPISGTVDHVKASRGMLVEPTLDIMEIVNTDHLHLKLQVFEKDVMKIQEGQKINFSLPQAPSTNYVAEVWLVGRTIDENRQAAVHAHLADSIKDRFAVGMFVEAQIITNSNLHPALPEEGIVEVENSHYVLVLENWNEEGYVFIRQQVNPQNNYKGFTAITSADGFAGKQILIKGAFDLIGN